MKIQFFLLSLLWSRSAAFSSKPAQKLLQELSISAGILATTIFSPFPILTTSQPSFFIANALTEQQLLVTDVWNQVTQQFVDPTFNGLGPDQWRQKRLQALQAVANPDPDQPPETLLYPTIRKMLSYLDDPYTRFLTPDQFSALTTYATGGSTAGIGVSLLVHPQSGAVVVASTVPNGPAEQAGIRAGDILIQVAGETVVPGQTTAEEVAAKCRGEVGSSIQLVVQHAATTESNVAVSDAKSIALNLNRRKLQVNPVVASVATLDDQSVGVFQVSAFTQETVSQMVQALRDIQTQSGGTKLAALCLDLRGNVGGYMPAGVDVAKLFLKPPQRIISEIDGTGRKTIYIADGIGSHVDLPLYILVDARTASAAEILTAGLQDNGRAMVVGNSRTFGKGRIQNVQALENGSGVAVTKAKYLTPKGKDIHKVGIAPDQLSQHCGPTDSAVACLAPAFRVESS